MKVVKLEDCINEIKSLDNNGIITRSVNHICEDMRKEVKEFDAIPITENMTNGDVIMAMFSDAVWTNHINSGIHCAIGNISWLNCDKDWWDAPYKKGIEE